MLPVECFGCGGVIAHPPAYVAPIGIRDLVTSAGRDYIVHGAYRLLSDGVFCSEVCLDGRKPAHIITGGETHVGGD